MKSFIFFFLVLFSFNSQAYVLDFDVADYKNKDEAIKVLKEQIEEKNQLYKKLKKTRKIYLRRGSISTSKKNSLSGFLYDLKHEEYPYKQFYYGSLGIPVHFLYLEMTDEMLKARSRSISNKFLRWAYRAKISVSMLFFLILTDRYVSHKGDKKVSEFQDLYQKYTKTDKLMSSEKIKEMKESFKDPDHYLKMISKYKDYFKELKRFDSFLKDLEKSLEKSREELAILEKASKNSTRL